MRRTFVALLLLAMALAGRPITSSAQVTRADSAAVLLTAAAAFEAEGRWEVAEALYQYISERFGDTPSGAEAWRILTLPPGERVTSSGRVELQVWSSLYGLWLGVAVPAAFGAEDPAPFGIGLLLGGPGGFLAGRSLARSRSLSEGQVRAITFGSLWGTWQGLGWAEVADWGVEEVCDVDYCYEENDNSQEIFTAMILGGLAGVATGAILARKPIPSGVATTVSFGAFWGSWFGFAASVLAGLEGDDLLAGTLVGGDALLLATAIMAPSWNLSRGRARLVSIAGVIGALGGAGLDLLIQPDDEKVAVGIPLATSIAGLAIGARATRDHDRRASPVPGGLEPGLLNLNGRDLSLGIPTPFPTALSSESPGGQRWAPAIGVTLIRAEF